MKVKHKNTFTTIRTEGAILPTDLLQRISEGDGRLAGLRPGDYHLLPSEKLNEAINRSWNRLIGAWENFQTAQEKVLGGQPGTTETRERWLLPLFQELGYGRLQTSTAFDIEGKPYPISHLWGSAPIHLLGFNVALEKRSPGVAGAARTSPHSMVQEFLNRADDHLWAFLSNGLQLRILRDNVSLTRQAYVEFDLLSMMEGEVYSDFVLLWLLCHQSRVEGDKPEEFWLEKWSKEAQDQGARALDQLRDGVEQAISHLGTGFLAHPANQPLRDKLRKGELYTQDYYRQLLRMVYRLIFLFVAEDRDLLFDPDSEVEARERYTEYFSTQRLRRLAERSRGSRHADLYHTWRMVNNKLGSLEGCKELALPALGGFLFADAATPDLSSAELPNQNLLDAIRALAYTVDNRTLRPVDYKNLGPEELGSVYESLLELHPEMNVDAASFNLSTAAGHERKTTGSYYTPSGLIQVLLDSALDPVIEQALENENPEAALLDLKVCDPACGSGHFLIAASHRIAKHLAGVRTGDDAPSPDATRHALRDVIGHCMYGVDINPMSVELCKVSLWMESLEPGKPLSFLDHHIKCGNSLMGVGPGMDIDEIPDDAFQPAFGDDKATATALRRRNKRERGGDTEGGHGQLGFRWETTVIKDDQDLQAWVEAQSRKVERMPEDEAAQVQKKAEAYKDFLQSSDYIQGRLEFDLWTAAFFWPIPKGNAESMLAPTQQELIHFREGQHMDAELIRRVREISQAQNFFHWDFEFPHIFNGKIGGFVCTIGNPPWETMQLEELQFFASREPSISDLSGAKRKSAIKNLVNSNPQLAKEFSLAKKNSENENNFIRNSQRYPLSAVGKINTYALFAEMVRDTISSKGFASLILPTGVVTDNRAQDFFSELMNEKALLQLIGFENEAFIFPSVHNEFKFCILTTSGQNTQTHEPEFIFFCRHISQIRDKQRHFNLSISDLQLINPNTNTCPIFRTKTDLSLTKKIYDSSVIFINENSNHNPWNIVLKQGLFNLTSDSHLFQEAKPDNNWVPLYEAKMIWQYDHRFASLLPNYNGTNRPSRKYKGWFGVVPDNPAEYVQPRYWVDEKEVENNIPENWKYHWFLGFRDITNVVVERSAIFSIIPRVGVGNSLPIIFTETYGVVLLACLLANLNSIVFDYIARQKIGGTHLNFYILKQLPILEPSLYDDNDQHFISPRVLELVYTSWDLKPYGYNFIKSPPFIWNDSRRQIIRAELDAYYARLYGLNRDELNYILDPHDIYGEDFPGETFRVMKDKEIKEFGEYRTKNLVLTAWDRMQEAIDNGTEYVPMVDPPPAHPSMAHPPREGGEAKAYSVPAPEKVVEVEKPESEPEVQAAASEIEEEEESEQEPERETDVSDRPPTDYSVYKCVKCNKMVMAYDKENHNREVHGGRDPGYEKFGK